MTSKGGNGYSVCADRLHLFFTQGGALGHSVFRMIQLNALDSLVRVLRRKTGDPLFLQNALREQSLLCAGGVGLAVNTLIVTVIVNWWNRHYMIAFAAVVAMTSAFALYISRAFVFFAHKIPANALFSFGRMHIYMPAAFFFILTTIYVCLFYFNAPYYDHWSFVRFYRLMSEGSAHLGDMFVMAGGHWHASAYLILYGLAETTAMNHFFEGIFSLFFALSGFVAIAVIVKRAADVFNAAGAVPWLLGVSAGFWFSLDQGLNWLWGWQIVVFITTAGAAWSIVLLTCERLTPVRFGLAVAATAAAILSFSTGLAILPVGFALLVFHWRRSDASRSPIALTYLALWGAFSIAAAAVFWQLNFAADNAYGRQSEAALFGVEALGAYTGFAFYYMASPITRFASGLALPVIIASAILFGWALRKSNVDWRAMRPPPAVLAVLALIAFGVIAGFLIGLGRAVEFGAEQGFSTRYISFGNFIWIGISLLVLLVALRGGQRMNWRAPAIIVLSVLCVLKAGNSVNAGKNYAEESIAIRAAGQAIVAGRPQIDRATTRVLNGNQDVTEEDLSFLEQEGLSFFRASKRENEPG